MVHCLCDDVRGISGESSYLSAGGGQQFYYSSIIPSSSSLPIAVPKKSQNLHVPATKSQFKLLFAQVQAAAHGCMQQYLPLTSMSKVLVGELTMAALRWRYF